MPVVRSFDVTLGVSLCKQLNKQSRGRWWIWLCGDLTSLECWSTLVNVFSNTVCRYRYRWWIHLLHKNSDLVFFTAKWHIACQLWHLMCTFDGHQIQRLVRIIWVSHYVNCSPADESWLWTWCDILVYCGTHTSEWWITIVSDNNQLKLSSRHHTCTEAHWGSLKSNMQKQKSRKIQKLQGFSLYLSRPTVNETVNNIDI